MTIRFACFVTPTQGWDRWLPSPGKPIAAPSLDRIIARLYLFEGHSLSDQEDCVCYCIKILLHLNVSPLQTRISLHHNHNILLVFFLTMLVYHDYMLNQTLRAQAALAGER